MRKLLFIMLATFSLVSCKGNAQEEKARKKQQFEISKSESEWKKELTDAEFKVLRKKATERPFSSDLLTVKGNGTFTCAACGNELYENKYKFESGTGWPSFDRAIEGGVAFGSDSKLGYQRDEVHCAKCGGHLGHVFNDGPRETTGKRHCINGVAMDFEATNK
ncbi:peptide-methionine (R)-S-oxide reductase MsrB [Zunongwangia sp. HGR-M22]|uniref:peptide-methionine (R)-S-oxide reductase MsrB n=1 Tax=Zunongwangia sp. HGR-M22 TaxID=3015168 RepID=UPI0022DD4AD3|nr:peptide-methionine (R)-S-oxide reductase MsrB [Zunongwangia sp. HGR-M22]WBL24463.1 peptide-methionine (R)-S-oxide reductase MsrB [Zunongwangia sp. HGR-M22]